MNKTFWFVSYIGIDFAKDRIETYCFLEMISKEKLPKFRDITQKIKSKNALAKLVIVNYKQISKSEYELMDIANGIDY